jgi:hypothetical protein
MSTSICLESHAFADVPEQDETGAELSVQSTERQIEKYRKEMRERDLLYNNPEIQALIRTHKLFPADSNEHITEQAISALLILVGLAIATLILRILWTAFGNPPWVKLRSNVRNGLFRLYVALSLPWTVWFVYLIVEAESHRQRDIPSLLCLLLLVPLGIPILFVVISWILDGFRVAADAEDDPKGQAIPGRSTARWPYFGSGFTKAPPSVD